MDGKIDERVPGLNMLVCMYARLCMQNMHVCVICVYTHVYMNVGLYVCTYVCMSVIERVYYYIMHRRRLWRTAGARALNN